MSKPWERFFFVFTYITQGSSYLSPKAYGILHRVHHAYTDTELDPHSPSYDDNLFAMMWRTEKTYAAIMSGTSEVEDKFTKNVPEWTWFDKWCDSNLSRILWILVYILIYSLFAPSLWWFC